MVDDSPMVTIKGVLDMQVCVPSDWTDEQVKQYADRANLCGTTVGWAIRKDGDKRLDGAPARVECEKRRCFVHIMLEA